MRFGLHNWNVPFRFGVCSVAGGDGQNQSIWFSVLPRLDLASLWVTFENEVFQLGLTAPGLSLWPQQEVCLGFGGGPSTTATDLDTLWHRLIYPRNHRDLLVFPARGLFIPLGFASLLVLRAFPHPAPSMVRNQHLGVPTICILPWIEVLSSAWSTHCKGIWGYANVKARNQKLRRFIIKLQ